MTAAVGAFFTLVGAGLFASMFLTENEIAEKAEAAFGMILAGFGLMCLAASCKRESANRRPLALAIGAEALASHSVVVLIPGTTPEAA